MNPHRDEDARAGLEGPAWRWKWITSAPSSRERLGDSLVRDGLEHRRLRGTGANGCREAARRYPGLESAIRIQEADESTDALMIMSLADCERSEMVRRTKLAEADIELWEKLFFDVRARLRSTGWIGAHIIEPLVQGGNGWLAARLRLALVGGPIAAASILDTDATTGSGEAERLFQRDLKLQLKLSAAAVIPIRDERHALKFVALFVQLKGQEQQLELARERLRARCQRDLYRHEAAIRRLAAAQERGQQILEARRRKRGAGTARPRPKRSRKEQQQGMAAVRAEMACPGLTQLKWKCSTESPHLQAANVEAASVGKPDSILVFSETQSAPETASTVEAPAKLEGTAA